MAFTKTLLGVMTLALCIISRTNADVEVMILSGHVADPVNKPNTRGAASYRGVDEYSYNDRITELFLEPGAQIEGVKYVPILATRNLELRARSTLANRHAPDIYLEIHHDSARQIDRDRATADGIDSPLWGEMSGYSIHFSAQSAAAEQSRRFADVLGRAMQTAGFKPNDYLAKRIGMQLVDPRLGIYNRIKPHGLYIFRAVKSPVVLLEVGNIANPAEEQMIAQAETRHRVVSAVNEAVSAYFGLAQ